MLLAVCDANYTFTLVDIGAYGSQSDGGILQASTFGKRLVDGTLDLPNPRPLEENMDLFPYYMVGDAAFPLKRNIMRPYPGLILDDLKQNFNKRLSRARRTIENTFGILTARWRILRQTLELNDRSAETIVQATVVLHNFLKMNDGSYCPPNYVDSIVNDTIVEGLWRQEVRPLPSCRHVSSNNAARTAFQLRDKLKEFLHKKRI